MEGVSWECVPEADRDRGGIGRSYNSEMEMRIVYCTIAF